MRVRGVGSLAANADRHALGALRSAGELALRRLAVDEVATRSGQSICRARAVGPLLFSDDEQQIDPLFAILGQSVRGTEHRGRDALRIGGAAASQAIALQPRRQVRRYRVE